MWYCKNCAVLYKSHVQDLDSAVASFVFGVKQDSPFNKLGHFHVCQPGLPPCLGHDLFQGVVSYDLALFVNRLVEEKHFTLEIEAMQKSV